MRLSSWHSHALLFRAHVTDMAPFPQEAGCFLPLVFSMDVWDLTVSMGKALQMAAEDAHVHRIFPPSLL